MNAQDSFNFQQQGTNQGNQIPLEIAEELQENNRGEVRLKTKKQKVSEEVEMNNTDSVKKATEESATEMGISSEGSSSIDSHGMGDCIDKDKFKRKRWQQLVMEER